VLAELRAPPQFPAGSTSPDEAVPIPWRGVRCFAAYPRRRSRQLIDTPRQNRFFWGSVAEEPRPLPALSCLLCECGLTHWHGERRDVKGSQAPQT